MFSAGAAVCHCTKISAEYDCGSHSPIGAHPPKSGIGQRRWKNSVWGGYIVFNSECTRNCLSAGYARTRVSVRNFHWGVGYSPGCLGVQCPAPVGVSGTSSPIRSWRSVQTLFTDFDCRNDQNLKVLHNLPPHPWPLCFTVGD